ncbi:hypothetical protein ACP70R_034863 [Stipagrostis hirtigluma subsp. patula]
MAGGVVVNTGRRKDYPGKLTMFVLLACIVAATGGLIFGYDIGMSGGVTSMDPFLMKFFPSVYRKEQGAERDQSNQHCKFDSQLLTTFTSSLYLAALVAACCYTDGRFSLRPPPPPAPSVAASHRSCSSTSCLLLLRYHSRTLDGVVSLLIIPYQETLGTALTTVMTGHLRHKPNPSTSAALYRTYMIGPKENRKVAKIREDYKWSPDEDTTSAAETIKQEFWHWSSASFRKKSLRGKENCLAGGDMAYHCSESHGLAATRNSEMALTWGKLEHGIINTRCKGTNRTARYDNAVTEKCGENWEVEHPIIDHQVVQNVAGRPHGTFAIDDGVIGPSEANSNMSGASALTEKTNLDFATLMHPESEPNIELCDGMERVLQATHSTSTSTSVGVSRAPDQRRASRSAVHMGDGNGTDVDDDEISA